ncbi:MAG TPA: transketolase [Spirochaetia bacterium]|nr:transketolase [Spirochaetia bacterium]
MSLDLKQLEDKARKLRMNIIRMIGVGRKGHLGGSCSLAEIVSALYFHKMRHDPTHPGWEERDRFLLSKGHAALVQYAALAECGYFPEGELERVKELGAMLQGHPDMRKTPGIEANTGSLGQGLSIACGMAAGLRLNKRHSRVYCVVGDGEMAEGQIWEAAMAAAYYKLDNLIAILDHNGITATGPIVERFDTNPIPSKWEAFGWNVQIIDGHSMKSIVAALDKADRIVGQPKLIIAHTIKGRGIPFAENSAAYHNGQFTQEQYDQALRELAG